MLANIRKGHYSRKMPSSTTSSSRRSSSNSSTIDIAKVREIPYGLFFEFLSCPHYFFEIASWIGFSLITRVFPGMNISIQPIFIYLPIESHMSFLYLIIQFNSISRCLYFGWRWNINGLGERTASNLYPTISQLSSPKCNLSIHLLDCITYSFYLSIRIKNVEENKPFTLYNFLFRRNNSEMYFVRIIRM